MQRMSVKGEHFDGTEILMVRYCVGALLKHLLYLKNSHVCDQLYLHMFTAIFCQPHSACLILNYNPHCCACERRMHICMNVTECRRCLHVTQAQKCRHVRGPAELPTVPCIMYARCAAVSHRRRHLAEA